MLVRRLLSASAIILIPTLVTASELDDLSGLEELDSTEQTQGINNDDKSSGNSLEGMGDSLETVQSGSSSEEESEKENSFQFSGYIKPLVYWGRRNFSSDTWGFLTNLNSDGITIPQQKEYSGYSDLGARMQFRMEGFIGKDARVFSSVNLDYNEAGSNVETNIQLVETYVEIFNKDATWKLGNQLVTWGFMEGIEVPTDRVNAIDYAYASTEYEDAKIASTGVLYQASFNQFDGLDLMLIPVGRINNDSPDQDRLYSQNSDILPAKDTSNMKSAIRYYFTTGNLDVALSYVDGTDPRPDVTLLGTSPNQSLQRSYHREKSPGVDLQYNFGSVLGKIAYAEHITNDTSGNDASIKNSWKHLAIGAEFNVGSSTANLYVGTRLVNDFNDSTSDRITTNVLMGQGYEQVNFISGHVISNFLTGNALTTTVLFASYWNNSGKMVQYVIKPTLTYKLADSLQVQLSPSQISVDDTLFQSLQLEVKYSF